MLAQHYTMYGLLHYVIGTHALCIKMIYSMRNRGVQDSSDLLILPLRFFLKLGHILVFQIEDFQALTSSGFLHHGGNGGWYSCCEEGE